MHSFGHDFWTALFAAIAVTWIVQAMRATLGMSRVPWLRDSAPVSDAEAPPISVIVAARDEAAALPAALATLVSQDYPRYEVIAVNDRSRDATGDILRQFANASNRLRVVEIAELPPGWMGKPHALARGAAAATGEWLVFTDADVHFAPDVLRRAATLVRVRSWDHLSLLCGFEMSGFWERAFLGFFTLAFIIGNEPWNVPNKRSKRYAGVGAFQMVRRTAYDAVGGHGALAMEVIEDMRLGKIVKRGGFASGLGLAETELRLRWYSGLGEIVRGLTKNMFAALEFSVFNAIAGSMLALTMSALPFAGVIFLTGWARLFAGVAAATAMIFHGHVNRGANISPLYALTHPLDALIFAFVIWRSMFVTLARGGIVWRGTFYRLADLRRGAVLK